MKNLRGPKSMRAAWLAVLATLAVGAAIALTSSPAVADANLEGGGNPAVQLVATLEAPTEIVRSGNSLPLRVRVVDQYGVPMAGVTVRGLSDGGVLSPEQAFTDESGLARFTYSAMVTDVREFTIMIEVTLGEAIPDVVEMRVTVLPVVSTRPVLSRPETAVSAGIGAALLAAVASTEFGRYGLFNLVVFPLYSRLKKEEVLDHFVRGQIYGFISAHPGEHYNSLKDALKVTNGTLAHHLRTLEIQGFVKSLRDGIYKRFYPVEMQIPRDKGIRLSDLQENILGLIRHDGGPTQQEIAGQVGVSQQTVSYNLRHLSREGLVRMEKLGRTKRYFPVET